VDERKWEACEDPARMLEWLTTRSGPSGYYVRHNGGRPLSDRKLRLFACACAREVYSPLLPGVTRVLGVAERVADQQPQGWYKALLDARHSIDATDGWVWCATCGDIAVGLRETMYHYRDRPTPATQAALLREIVGNPFRPVPSLWGDFAISGERGRHPLKDWLTPRALSIAEHARATRDWPALWVMADALEEAGCPTEEKCSKCQGDGWRMLGNSPYSAETVNCGTCHGTSRIPSPLLAHLRSPGPHARGCWALDLLLGRE
jgi:hypothetical protein